eukprot:scaffold39540_cov51-Cyclotella_meneghiniana.AAC.1
MKKSRDSTPPPQLAKSDVESDSDDDSLSSDPVIESGGDNGDPDESYWKDHPITDKDEPELPTFEPVDSPTKSPEEAPSTSPEEVEEDNDLGRSADGKSRRLRRLVSM